MGSSLAKSGGKCTFGNRLNIGSRNQEFSVEEVRDRESGSSEVGSRKSSEGDMIGAVSPMRNEFSERFRTQFVLMSEVVPLLEIA